MFWCIIQITRDSYKMKSFFQPLLIDIFTLSA